MPPEQAAPILACHLSRANDNQKKLRVQSHGNVHVQVKVLRFRAKTDTEPEYREDTSG